MPDQTQSSTLPSNPKCKLCKSELQRIPRAPLMKLLPTTRQYVCTVCGERFFKFMGVLQKG